MHRHDRRLRRLLPVVVAAGIAAATGAADASITTGYEASRPFLKVDSRGYAEVDWTEGGTRRSLLIPPTGRYLPGGHITGGDVSRPAAGVTLPYLRVLRRTRDGRLWRLQAWAVAPNGRVELRLSRWNGAPTTVTAGVDGGRLTGAATFQGRGVFGVSPTTAGTPIRLYAWIDCWRCQGASGWRRLAGVPLAGSGGSFSLFLKPAWQAGRYRVTVPGPNRGATYAPDASVVVAAG